MPRLYCVKCKASIPRGAEQRQRCVDCNDVFHFDCIVEHRDNSGGAPIYRCDNCTVFQPPRNSSPHTLGTTPLSPSNNHAVSVQNKPSSLQLSAESSDLTSDNVVSPSVASITSGKRQRSSPSPDQLSRVNKLPRSNSHRTMSHTLTQRELDLRARRDEIEANAPDWHQLFLTDYRATTAANEQRFEAIEKKNDCILRALSQTDENEIKISGIPTGLNVPLIQSAVRLLQEIGLTSPSHFILDHREWPAKENESHQSIIVKLVGGVRETVLRNASKLKGKTAQSIFGSGGNTRIYINQVYPRHVYKLL
ncbi:hypothetical protein QAD02_020431 [Eretmocerus hayati]|uniref:Uncharacterized protein n=1 Tax=Eretmocerus hayati TaxID=131215 RepID=A0ACC2PMG7_9HYME|nr:hypothetical protein QAD02_020431 [Eretmocerus hayati]